jgi:hypothetical protein
METTTDRRSWSRLDDHQRGLAAELMARAEQLRAQADEEGLSVADAVALAAVQLGLAG